MRSFARPLKYSGYHPVPDDLAVLLPALPVLVPALLFVPKQSVKHQDEHESHVEEGRPDQGREQGGQAPGESNHKFAGVVEVTGDAPEATF